MRKIIIVITLMQLLAPSLAQNLIATVRVTSDGAITGLDSAFTQKSKEYWSVNFDALQEYSTTSLKIYLPKNSILEDIETNTDYSITYENSLVINLHALNSTPSFTISYHLRETSEVNYYALIIIALVAAIIVLTLKMRRGKNRILSLLTQRERQVYLTIKELGGTAKQSKLRRVTGLPKSTLFRTIKNLESKKMVMREGEGVLGFIKIIK